MSRRRIALLAILGVLVLGAVLAVRWFPAALEPGYSAVGEWGGTGSGPGRLDGPIGIAVSGDEVFVSDSRNGRIQVFDLGGSFLRELGWLAMSVRLDITHGCFQVILVTP